MYGRHVAMGIHISAWLLSPSAIVALVGAEAPGQPEVHQPPAPSSFRSSYYPEERDLN